MDWGPWVLAASPSWGTEPPGVLPSPSNAGSETLLSELAIPPATKVGLRVEHPLTALALQSTLAKTLSHKCQNPQPQLSESYATLAKTLSHKCQNPQPQLSESYATLAKTPNPTYQNLEPLLAHSLNFPLHSFQNPEPPPSLIPEP
jgi:hypothetical protein